MEEELADLKTELRSLVISSPTPVCMNNLQNDYREMIGRRLPFQKFGYRDVITFIKERFSDTFVLEGNPRNPILTPIVPETLKHIDQMISRQKLSAKDKFKGKRRSILGPPNPPSQPSPSHSNNTTRHSMGNVNLGTPNPPSQSSPSHINGSTRHNMPANINNKPQHIPNTPEPKPITKNIQNHTTYTSISPSAFFEAHRTTPKPSSYIPENYQTPVVSNYQPRRSAGLSTPSIARPVLPAQNGSVEPSFRANSISPRTPSAYMASTSSLSEARSETSFETSSSKIRALEDMKTRMRSLIKENPDGIWCVDLMTKYKQRFNTDLSYLSAGCPSVIALVRKLTDVFTIERPDPTGDWLLYDATRPPPPPRLRVHPQKARFDFPQKIRFPDEDALPGVPYEPGVFPEDCMQLGDFIPMLSLAEEGIQSGDYLNTQPGEVYSPSHFWLMRLGEDYYTRLDKLMDAMNVYYKGEGADRSLSLGAVREGQYVSAYYSSDWHRAVIVNVVDSDNVKLRYIDFGTVEKVPSHTLKPLLKIYAELPAQAIRSRLAGVKPPAGGTAWPATSCSAFLAQIINKPLVAEVLTVDTEENILEVYLIDTNTDIDVCINDELIKQRNAERHYQSYLHATDSHLYPLFDALETALTLSYPELEEMRRLGLRPEFMEEYSKHTAPPRPLTPFSPEFVDECPAHSEPILQPLPSFQDTCVHLTPQQPASTSNDDSICTIPFSKTDMLVFLRLEHLDKEVACRFISEKFRMALGRTT